MNKGLAQSFIFPEWPAPSNVCAIQTTRLGGVSSAPYDSLNLGDHVNDDPHHVAINRQLLASCVPTEPVWMNQVHGIRVLDAAKSSCIESADAALTTQKDIVCVTMTADCLPILLCNRQGTIVSAIHAGWRGLCDGVIEATIEAMAVNSDALMAWLGPAIGPDAFEVGVEVRAQFIEKDQQAASAFKVYGNRYLADLYQLARQRLNNAGVTQINGGGLCTHTDASRFFSYRRDGATGRMATLIWLK
ncbi:MAG: peptidoglycan editing factor PgeF [Methylophilaceae bacterium]|jgi:polyphenol oxidase|nr:MAG: peptidoglycan editing factor PgeF [Methylophilaceae bacterium]